MPIKSFLSNFINKKRYTGISRNVLDDSESFDKDDYLKANELSLYLNRAIEKRAEKVSEIEFVVKRGEKVVENHQLINLLYKPNNHFIGREFWKLYQKYYDLIGSVYIWVEKNNEIFEGKKIKGLHLLNPLWVKTIFNKDTGDIEKYEYNQPNFDLITYRNDEVIRIINPDPRNPLQGVSLLKPGMNAVETEIQIGQYHANVLKNGGKVEGVFKFKTDRITPQQLLEIKNGYKKEMAGAKKSGMPLFLGGDAEYTKIGLTPEELDYLEAKKMTLNDICTLTGVPKTILADVSDVKFDNADASIRVFLSETIKPLLILLTTKLDEMLFPQEETLTFIDPTPENLEQKRKNIETANSINALTINEKRKLLAEIGISVDPIANDELLVPFNLSPLSDSSAKNNGSGNGEKKSLQEIDHPLRDSYFRRKYYELMIKREDKRILSFERVVKGYFDEQSQRITGQLDTSINRTFRRKNLIDDIFSSGLELKIAKEKFIPILTELLIQAGEESKQISGSKFDFVVGAEISSWLDKRVEIFSDINETTFKKLQKEFEISLSNNESRQDLIKRIQETYDGISKGRAGTIARTEVHAVTQKGTLEGYRQGGMPIKIWVAVMDSHTRDSHAALDGEERPIGMPFSNGLMYPGENGAPAGEVINCRCQI